MTYRPDVRQIKTLESILLILVFVCLILIAAVARWSWLLLDEQILLRQELEDLKGRQGQIETQYEFWLEQLESDLQRLEDLSQKT